MARVNEWLKRTHWKRMQQQNIKNTATGGFRHMRKNHNSFSRYKTLVWTITLLILGSLKKFPFLCSLYFLALEANCLRQLYRIIIQWQICNLWSYRQIIRHRQQEIFKTAHQCPARVPGWHINYDKSYQSTRENRR